jgi:CHASE2 domain-containing sensor protein
MALYSPSHARLFSRPAKSLGRIVVRMMRGSSDSKPSEWKRDWRVGVLVTILALCFLVFGWIDILSYDLLFVARPTPPALNEVAMVYIDDESHRILKQRHRPMPWDRKLHAQLIERLTQFGARVIAIDVLLDQTTEPEADKRLVEAAKKSGKVVVVGVMERKQMGDASIWESQQPFADLAEVAPWGAVESPERLLYRDPNVGVPSLAARAAELFPGQNPPEPRERWMNYYGPAGTLPWHSYHEVLSDDSVAATFSNKVVFVGENVRIGIPDTHPIPHTRWTGVKSPGVDLNATAYLNLVREDWLTRFPVAAEILIVVVCGLLLPMLLGRFLPILSIVVSVLVSAAVFAATCLVAFQFRYWFPWLIVSGVEVPCVLACVLILKMQRVTKEMSAVTNKPALAEHRTAHSVIPAAPNPNDALVINEGNRFEAPAVPDCTMIRKIGEGSFGEVWLARNVLGSFRAVKVIHRSRFEEDRPFEREFEGIQHFEPISRQHPGLVQVLHVGRNQERGFFFYVMELADDIKAGAKIVPQSYEARTLASEISQRRALPVRECVQLAVHLSETLSFLHGHGLIHRDIKPGNIIYSGGRPKFADVGLVTLDGNNRSQAGTPGYIPPEGTGFMSGDIYSLGKTFYRAYTGLAADRFPELPTALPDTDDVPTFQRFNRIILKACERKVSDRYQTAAELYQDLLELSSRQ